MQNHLVEIKNLFLDFPNYNCFGCSPWHEYGFRLKFFIDPKTGIVQSTVDRNREELSGFPGILHGGFQALLLDEIMYWAVFGNHKKTAVTASMEVKYQKSLSSKEPFELKAKVIRSVRDKIFLTEGWIEKDGIIYSKSEGKYAVPRIEDFKKAAGVEELPESFLELF